MVMYVTYASFNTNIHNVKRYTIITYMGKGNTIIQKKNTLTHAAVYLHKKWKVLPEMIVGYQLHSMCTLPVLLHQHSHHHVGHNGH